MLTNKLSRIPRSGESCFRWSELVGFEWESVLRYDQISVLAVLPVEWSTRMNRRNGSCAIRVDTMQPVKIRVNAKLASLSDAQDQVRLTLSHEAAHALTPGQGHGPSWVETCRILGGTGERFRDSGIEDSRPIKTVAICASCFEPILGRRKLARNKIWRHKKCPHKRGEDR